MNDIISVINSITGGFFENYPYILGILVFTILVVLLIFLQNFLYVLLKFIGGDRR